MSVRLCRTSIGPLLFAFVVLGIVLFFPDATLAQTGPFGAPRPPSIPHADGIVGWVLDKQGEFYRQLSGLIRAAKADGSAVWALLGLSFLYGIFHAAGPGHGKAVISSYMIANGETWRRGVVLSFVSAMLQATVAVVLVAIAAGLIGVTAKAMGETVRWIEIASYSLIALVGLQLTWIKGRGLVRAWRTSSHEHQHVEDLDHGPDHRDLLKDHHRHDGCSHRHRHAAATTDAQAHTHHDNEDHAGHSHGPTPQELAGPGGWKRGFSAIVAVGLRPCSGAILVLVFALAQGLFWAGIAATFMIGLGTALTVAIIATLAVSAKSLANRLAGHHGEGRGALIVRGVEFVAALVVLVFGAGLLAGYIVSERLI
jgi:nickel/cobalt exporter